MSLLLSMADQLEYQQSKSIVQKYKSAVLDLVALVDKSETVADHYLDVVIYEQFSITQAAECWFETEHLGVYIESVSDGILETTLRGFKGVYKVMLPIDIKPGETFLAHFVEDISQLIQWKGDLFSSLEVYKDK